MVTFISLENHKNASTLNLSLGFLKFDLSTETFTRLQSNTLPLEKLDYEKYGLAVNIRHKIKYNSIFRSIEFDDK